MNAISVREERPQDEAFLFELYASTRQEELAAWGWPPALCDTFLTQQFRASQGYRNTFPEAEFQIILLDGLRAGRLIVHRSREELRVVDLALLPPYRNAGIGSALLRRLFGEAAATGKPLRLQVRKANRAGQLYQRLGFVPINETEVYCDMEWRALAVPAVRPVLPDALKLPLQFDVGRMQAEVAQLAGEHFVPHFNTDYYQGDWSAAPLRALGGRADHIYPDPTARDGFAETPLLARCPYLGEILATLRCPQQSARLLRLKAGSVIREHRDHELGFEDGEVRLHIPVHTNPGVDFVLNQVRLSLREGECWYLNVNQPHRVANHGATDRIHLVIDCVVNDWLRDLLLGAVPPSAPASG